MTDRWNSVIRIAVGPVFAVLIYLLLPDSYVGPDGQILMLSHAARATAAMGSWMALWWLTEAVPVPVTALLPLALFPLLGISDARDTAVPYAHPLIFLFMGGFIIARAIERWGMHRRLAFVALSITGTRPKRIIGSFMLISAVMSMWVSNTATTIMMLPIALSVIGLVVSQIDASDHSADGEIEKRNFALGLLLGIAYASSIGGIGTLIGTGPNLLVASFLDERLQNPISFARWMMIGLPLVVVFVPVTWWFLVRVLFPQKLHHIQGGRRMFESELRGLGPMSRAEKTTLAVFALTATLWISRPWLGAIEIGGVFPFSGLTDTGVAIGGAILLFVLPVSLDRRQFVLDWETAAQIPWGLLVLFGGGLSLAAAVDSNGVSQFLGSMTQGLAGVPAWVVIAIVVASVIFLTELTSNTATTATMLPVLAAVAPGLGIAPATLVIAAGIAASCAFMLPVATPPNAIVYGSGMISVRQMAKAGVGLNLIGILLITLLTVLVIVPLLDL